MDIIDNSGTCLKLLIVLLFLGQGSDNNTLRAGSVTMAMSVGIHTHGKYAWCPGRCHRGLGTGPELNSCFSGAAPDLSFLVL